ncbi:energy transducer TonB [uncultured Pseudoalteromonas sp.]|uniref:energy transducer TonB n=1 Tax=uncultured Pseudoalteromonas sp. TaxID=114053 RepID=UPI0025955E09|nr:energy transducer TonB [uncultured Pseudoalteromonas sp.]
MKYITIFLVLLLVGCNSTDKAANSSTVYTNAQTDSPAKWVVKIEPKYPEDAAKNNVEGYIKFKAIVNEVGALERVEVIESAPKGVFEKEGLRALKLWRFKPALLNGRLVKVEYAGTLEWKL